jgi:hypothetical protein
MEKRLLDVLQRLLEEQAHSALSRPQKDGDAAFNYGHAAGVYAGIKRALEAVKSVIRDELEEEEHGI